MLGTEIIHILLIEDEEYDVGRVRSTIAPFRDQIVIRDVASTGSHALELLKAGSDRYDVVVMDFQIAGGLMGEELIRAIKTIDPSLQIIIVTKMTVNVMDFDFANRLLQAGAYWYCTKYPGDIDTSIYQPTDFILSLYNAHQKRLLERERLRSASRMTRTVEGLLSQKQILGGSARMEELRHQIRKCADNIAPVLITGPSGSGKELVAHNVHYHSQRRLENFIPINCGSLPHDLVESELFGYEKGAFTGASTRKLGLFEVADRGTVFLDEVAELPPGAQVKLLRVLQDGEIEKIGRTEKLKVNVRVIAATNKDLAREVEFGKFREDLFYRLNVLQLAVPALRDHPEDIPLYVDHYLKEFSADMNRDVPGVQPDAMLRLQSHPWPGNVRELKNVTQRLLFDPDHVITSERVGLALGSRRVDAGWPPGDGFTFAAGGESTPLRLIERRLREEYVRYIRARSTSDADAAKKLGLAPPNYHRMCKELGIK
jgi:two-component system, NtrC family, response regulator AtoC